MLSVVRGFAMGIYKSYSDDEFTVRGIWSHLRYQSQYFGLVGDCVGLASYEVADFHESTSA